MKKLINFARETFANGRNLRKKLGVKPVYKRVDTCAAEFPSLTPYMYSKHNKKVQEIGTWDRYTFAILELTKLMELIQVEYIEWV